MADPAPLLDLIAKHEAEGAVAVQGVASAYDVVWGGIPKGHRPQAMLGRPLTRLTIGEVLDWQQDVVRLGSRSSAAGRYQFIRATLSGTRAMEGVEMRALFDAPMQDRLALRLLRGRGWDRLIAGTLDVRGFAEGLAREWASLPVHDPQQGASRWVKRGQSYYAGDGLNRASASPESVIDAITLALAHDEAPPPAPLADGDLLARVQMLEQQMAAILSAINIIAEHAQEASHGSK